MIAGVGYILVGVGIGTQFGLAAGLFYMVHHILVMGSLLLSSGAIENAYRTNQFVGLSGLMRREPLLAVIVAHQPGQSDELVGAVGVLDRTELRSTTP